MPIYEYVCEQCGESIEIIQKISEEPTSQCPSCYNHTLRKKTSISAFHLKGSGWYKDGYNGANQNQKKPDDKPGEPASTSSESKSEPTKSSETGSDSATSASNSPAESTSSAAG